MALRELRFVKRAVQVLPLRLIPLRAAMLIAVTCCIAGARMDAQSLLPKRTLTTAVAPGCDILAASPAARVQRNNAEARRLAAAGQEAALIGDRNAARSAFMRAAALNPGDERIAYDAARAHEELADTANAVSEYCRFLSLSPEGREAADVRARLPRLVSREAASNAERSFASFREGLRLYDARRYDAAADAFGETVRRSRAAPEGVFNRALSRAAAGNRAEAAKDFEAYLAAVPTADDRTTVARAIDVLRRPVYGAGSAFMRGLLPGFGQFYTGRPGRGVAVLALAAGAAGAAFYEKTETRTVPYVDPNGVPVPYQESMKKRPYLVYGAATAAALTLGAAIEASQFAANSSRGVARVSPYVGARGDVGLNIGLRF